MKYLFTVFIALCLFSCATQTGLNTGSIVPTEIENGKLLGIIPVQYGRGSYQFKEKLNASREDIFRQARRWAAFQLANPSVSFSVGDNLLGDIIIPGSMSGSYFKDGIRTITMPSTTYSISIECYDNYYRVTLTNIRMNGEHIEWRNTLTSKDNIRKRFQYVDTKMSEIIEDFDTFMTGELGQK